MEGMIQNYEGSILIYGRAGVRIMKALRFRFMKTVFRIMEGQIQNYGGRVPNSRGRMPNQGGRVLN